MALRTFSGLALASLIAVLASPSVLGATRPGKTNPETGKPAAVSQPPQQTPPGWRWRCESSGRHDPLTCVMEESAVLTQTGQLLVDFSIRIGSDSKTAGALIQIPVGVFLPSGLQLQIDDGAKLDLPLQTCEQRGCFAGTNLTSRNVADMRAGKALKVSFDNLNKQKLTVTLPLNGFGPAFDKIQ